MLFCNRIDVVKEDGIDMFGNIRLILSYPYRSDYKIKNHIELGKALDILDDEKGAQVSGARFVYLKNEAVFLEFALISYVFKILYSKGFIPVIPPVLVKERAMYGTGFLPVRIGAHSGEIAHSGRLAG